MSKYVLLIGLGMASLISCTREAAFDSARWAGQGQPPSPPPGFSLSNASLPVGTKSLLLQTQHIDGVEVEGTYYKKISEQGQAEFIDYRWMSTIPLSVRRDLLLMRAQKPFVLSSFLKSHEFLSRTDLVDGPNLVVTAEPEAQVSWKLVFEKEDGSFWVFLLDKDFEILSQKRAGSEFIEARAKIFPEGPLKSQLQTVLLKGLFSNVALSSDAVKMMTEADTVAIPAEEGELSFLENDIRFAQVQVFYYVTQALSWFVQNLNFQLPFPLEVETQKGFPDKTNAAFYFQHKIRLGDGDGDAYDKIPMDPSIVTHESMHAIIEAVASLPYEAEGGSLNEAYADFLTAVQFQNPRMGEASYKKAPFKRTIENNMTLQEVNGGLYHDSGIVSGLLWSLYKTLGPQEGLKVAWQTLLRLNPGSNFQTFKVELLSVLEQQESAVQKKSQAELKKRGWVE